MDTGKENQLKKRQDDNNGQGKDFVTVSIDDKVLEIHRGSHTVADLKTLAAIPLAYDLDKVTDGKLEPLPDDDRVTIKGGEIFISHPKDGSSS